MMLVLLALVVAIQVPFIYRHWKISQLSKAIVNKAEGRRVNDSKGFTEYKGIVHAHTNLGGHSTGSFDELIAAATANDLDFVVMTEHWSDLYDTSALTLNGVFNKTLFVGGNEIDTANSDRFLMIPGSSEAPALRRSSTNSVLQKLHSEGRLALVTYPEKFKSWDSDFDGIEVFSLHTNAKKMNPFTAVLDGIWSFPSYPELVLATYYKRPDANLQKFDQIAAERNISLAAGTDAHSNIGLHLIGDDTGKKFVNFKFDAYETIFKLARQHILIENEKPLTREILIDALKRGRSFIGMDVIGNSQGFTFEAYSDESGEIAGIMGDEVDVGKHLSLKVFSPLAARIVIFRNGEIIREASDSFELVLEHADLSGAYRVEVYLNDLGAPFDSMPWIISNPIYVR